jgi:thioredoxin reductase
MSNLVEVAIIGAGPYGLSLAAHLRQCGVSHRIFGNPMQTWLTQMPRGMFLKSDGYASSLYDRDFSFTLKKYCAEKGIPYQDHWKPVSLETFSDYGLEFQRRFVPELDTQLVMELKRTDSHFDLLLESGHSVAARNVIVAAGISHFAYLPPELTGFPEEWVSHSSLHSDLAGFKGREVIVIGAGASAVDIAALLHEVGANVQLTARRAEIDFPVPPKKIPRPFWEELRHPTTGLGAGWRMVFCTHGPQVFHLFPMEYRHKVVRRFLGPAPGPFLKERVVGKVQFHLGCTLLGANVSGGRVSVRLKDAEGVEQTLHADHVIAATGYRVDLERLAFLRPILRSGIALEENAPALSTNFESSVPGLYFVGAAAAPSFGPLFRFALGAKYTARRLSRHLAKAAARSVSPGILESSESR